MSDAVKRLAELFEGFASAYGTHGVPVQEEGSSKWVIKDAGGARFVREPVTPTLWKNHVAGKRPLGIITIREDSMCRWGCIDYDVYDTQLTDVMQRVERAKLPLIPCRSKSGGLHLFLFLEEFSPAIQVIEILRDMAASLGIGGSEIFPKQKSIKVERGDLGSWMVMPYYGDVYASPEYPQGRIKMQVGLRTSGAELTLEEFIRAAFKARVSPQALVELVEAVKTSTKPRRGKAANGATSSPPHGPFADGPPCLQHMTAEGGVPRGHQNNALFMMGVYCKKAYPDDWKAKLEEMNATLLDPPGSVEAFQSLVRSLERRDYDYKCRDEPMASHCDSRACKRRKHGVGAWGELPEIGGLSVLVTDPVIWFVDVDGERLEIGTMELQNYQKFHAACMEKLQKCFNLLKQDTWLKQVNEAMTNVVTIPAPPDSGPGSVLHETIEDFLTNRALGTRIEDLLSDRPWLNDVQGRYEFTMRSLVHHIRREGMDAIPRGKLTRIIEKMGGGHAFRQLQGKGLNYWYVPADLFERRPEVSVPPVETQRESRNDDGF